MIFDLEDMQPLILKIMKVSQKASAETLDSAYTAQSLPSVQSELPPQDGGLQAWTFLLGASIVEAVTWGTYSKLERQ